MVDSAPSALANLLPGFAVYLETATNLQPVSQRRYLYEIRRFAQEMGGRPLAALTPQDLVSWNAAMHQAGMANGTVLQRHAALKRFLTYLEEVLQEEQAGGLLRVLAHFQTPRQGAPTTSRAPYALEAAEIRLLLASAGSHRVTGVRDKAMVNFLWATGVRNSELIGLELTRLNLEERLAVVLGKGGRERVVIYDAACQQHLKWWLAVRASWRLQCDRVFVSVSGRPLTPDVVGKIVRHAGVRAGLPQRVWVHLLRHSRLTHLLNQGMSLQDTAVLAGHRNVNTTMKYFHQGPEDLKRRYDAATEEAAPEE